MVRWPTVVEDKDLTAHQLAAVQNATRCPVGILDGSPGTGKSFCAAKLVSQIIQWHGSDAVAVVAPTGKAAVRVTQAMRRLGLVVNAITIHSMLKVGRNGHDGKGWGFIHNEHNPLPFRFVIIDEASMLCASLTASLLSACQTGTHVLFVGDIAQLPPVGHGAPLRDLIAAGVPCGELSEIRRNAGLIVKACAQIKNGQEFDTAARFSPDAGDNLVLMEAGRAEVAKDTLRRLLERMKTGGRFDPVWGCQVLVAVNDKGEISRKVLNGYLQGLLNPAGRAIDGNPFHIGDKVICLKNNLARVCGLDWEHAGDPPADVVQDADGYKGMSEETEYGPQAVAAYVANGEIGRVRAIGAKSVVIDFFGPDRCIKVTIGKQVEEEDGVEANGRGCDYDLSYAITTHKSQGSEWPCVIVMIDPAGSRVASREFHYTAISRASELCIMIGRKETVDYQCSRVSLVKRKTFLADLLRATK